ncbi:MAG: DUF4139 domain-containing protein [Crocinitomicaceae bacterium]|nr:DUF4139 domain-containing protein [Crocinitomicaceae bacterium]MBP6032565.1 DUF4139 domain-containing protein [Crocinitomicaceae bacterium]
MKRIFLFTALATFSWKAFATEKDLVKATLSEVTVYSQGAQLHHKANYTAKVGVTEVSIEGISPYIDPKSIQVKATGNVVILDSKYVLHYPQPTQVTEDGIPLKIKKSISLLEDSLRSWGFDIQEIDDEIGVLNATKYIISNNGSMKGTGRVNDSILLLKSAVDYYALKMNEINKKLLVLQRKKAQKVDTKQEMEERLEELRNYQNGNGLNREINKAIPRVVITISSNEVVSGKLNFSYVVSQAGWTPLYDLRSDSSTGKINLTYKAQVRQNSGLDWNDVRLNISTNNPYANKTKPELNPWYIDYQAAFARKLQETAVCSGTSAGLFNSQVTNMGYSFTQKESNMDDALSAANFTTVVQMLIAAEFKIDLPYTIPSNNDQHMVLIKQTDLATTFKYYAVPKLDPGVYLVAQMTKLDELQLIPAKANIFFDGSYIGETYIDPTRMEDTLNLSLGKDPNIVVKRTLLKKECKDKVIQDKRERTFAYTIEVRNSKSSSIDIVIQDQIPITQNTDITIESANLAKGRLNERTGVIEWSFNLKSKENKVIDFDYKIRHSKDKEINI